MGRQLPELAELRRALGRQLAMLREAAGLYQTDIARAVPCHRTTVTHAEAGSQLPDADFWETADSVVGANGALIGQYDAFIQAREAHKTDQRVARRARARSELAILPPNGGLITPSTATWNDLQVAGWQGTSLKDGDEHDALELARRVAASDVSSETLGRLEDMVDELAVRYPKIPPQELLDSVRRNISFVMRLIDVRKTLDEHRRLLIVGG
jgi:DNA-binding XRE family transcriptional regulator